MQTIDWKSRKYVENWVKSNQSNEKKTVVSGQRFGKNLKKKMGKWCKKLNEN